MRKFNWLFGLITLFVSLLLLEVGARVLEVFLVEDEVKVAATSPVFKRVSHSAADSVFVRTDNHPFISSDLSFPIEKSDRTIRIFCLGGSAAMGWPHDLNWSYPALLQKLLHANFPDHSFEIVNAAASTYGSFRVASVMEEVLDYDPDCIILYTGNNEFLEPELYRDQLDNPWNYLATARLFHRARNSFFDRISVKSENDYQPTFMIDIALGNSSPLKTSPEKYNKVRSSFRRNLSKMADLAEQKDVPMVLTTVPVNVRDWLPHASQHSADVDLAKWQAIFADALQAYRGGDAKDAANSFLSCVDQDSAYAKAYYYLGKSLIDLDKGALAERAFIDALEKDAYPFRCLPEFNGIIKKLTREKGVKLVDIAQSLEDVSFRGIIGDDALVDHVHPSIESNLIIAEKIFPAVVDLCALPEVRLDTANIDLLAEKPQPNITYYKHLCLIYRVLLQFDKLEELMDRLTGLPKEQKAALGFLALKGDIQRALQIIRPYIRLMQHIETGTANAVYEPQEIQDIIHDYIELNRYDLARNLSDDQFSNFVPKRY